MPTAAILVIDVQQALCSGPQAAWDCPGMIGRINQATAAARAAGLPVIWVQHEEPGLERGSAGWQLADGLQVGANDLRSGKRTGDAFWRTDLLPVLQGLGVQELVVCGMHTEYCVDVSTRAALRHGFPVVLLADAHTSSGNAAISAPQVIAHHNITLSTTSSFGVRARLLQVHQWMESLKG